MSNRPSPEPTECPSCGVSLVDNPVIGIEVQGVFDGVLFWQCPDCGAQWHRFDLTSRQYHVAAKHMTGERHA